MTSPAVRAATYRLRVDAVTAETVAALAAAGVEPILLKGPSITRWLYADGSPRAYSDTDLIVAPRDAPRAQTVLTSLGFEPSDTSERLGTPIHADTWLRSRDSAMVDLHRSLAGAEAEPYVVWARLAERTTSLAVGSVECRVLDRVGLALHIALHAAFHAADGEQPAEDLRRALARLHDADWREAADLAARIGASSTMSLGLRLDSEGAQVADRIGLAPPPLVELRLAAAGAPPTALGIAHLTRAPGVAAKAALLARKLVPSPGFMRAWSPLARRGRSGLLAAYMTRPLWIARHLPAGARAWWRERRRT